MYPRIFIVGANSTIGTALCSFLQHHGVPYIASTRRNTFTSTGHTYLHLGGDIASFLPPLNDGIVIICAGITSLQRCEADPVYTYAINVHATLQLMERLIATGNRIVFLSTSHVFDGMQPLPAPQAITNPQIEYGRQKNIVEKALSQMQPEALVVRLSKVLTGQDCRLAEWRLAWESANSIEAFVDMWVAPIFINQVVSTLYTLIEHNCSGIWHISPATEVTYAGLATKLARLWGYKISLVNKISAPPDIPELFCPRYVAMDSSATWQECGVCPPTSTSVLQEYVKACL